MKVAVPLLCVTLLCGAVNCGLVAAPLTTTLVRAPSYDSAIIQSDRIGGNFAYSTAESHAFAAISPVVQNVVRPVAVSYTAHPVVTPLAYATASLVPATTVVQSPVIVAAPSYAEQPVVAPADSVAVASDAVEPKAAETADVSLESVEVA